MASRIRDFAESVYNAAVLWFTPLIVTNPGTHTKFTMNDKGQVVSGTTLSTSDIPGGLPYIANTDAVLVVGAPPGDAANARQIAAGQNISLSDSGAGSTLSVGFSGIIPESSLPQHFAHKIRDFAEAVYSAAALWFTPLIVTNPGTHTKFTMNNQGQVVSGTTLSSSDIPVLNYVSNSDALVTVGAVPADLANGRRLTAGTNITLNDGGAGTTITINAPSPTVLNSLQSPEIAKARNSIGMKPQYINEDYSSWSLIARRFN